MWSFSLLTLMWTWRGGAPNASEGFGFVSAEEAGITGNPGVFSADVYPAARYRPFSAKDTRGIFWLYGGVEKADLWKFSPFSSQWAWVMGEPTYATSYPGSYRSPFSG